MIRHIATRAALSALLALSLTLTAAGCSEPVTADLAKSTPFALAREQGRFVEVEGLNLFAITVGSGRDVVLLHGNPSSTYTWRKVIGPLAEHYRVHALDLPGYGFSDKPADATYDTAWLARTVIGYMDSQQIQRAVLVGNSMGGHVASETAILYPARVDALVLIAAAGLATEDVARRNLPLVLRAATWPIVGPILRAMPARPAVADALRESVFDPTAITDEDVDAYYLPLRTRNGTTAFLRRMDDAVEPSRAELVAGIRAPTLVLAGDTDRLVSPAVARRYHDLIAKSRLVFFERTGHLPQEERPERTVAEIAAFLDEPPR